MDDGIPSTSPPAAAKADDTWQFDERAEDFALDLYYGDLAFYGLGRMIQRLDWHLQQAAMLTAEPRTDAEWPDLEIDQETIRQAGKLLRNRIKRCHRRQLGLARRTHEIILSLIQQLPVEYDDADRCYRRVERIWKEEFQGEPLEDLFADVESPDRLRRSGEEPLSPREACPRIAERHIQPVVGQYTRAIYKRSTQKTHALFLLGQALERAQCRSDVSALLTDFSDHLMWAAPPRLEECSDTSDRDAADAELSSKLLAYKDRAVGEMRPEDHWFTPIRLACRRVPATFKMVEWSEAPKGKALKKGGQTALRGFLQSIHVAVLRSHADIHLLVPAQPASSPADSTSSDLDDKPIPGPFGISFDTARRTLRRVGFENTLRFSDTEARIMEHLIEGHPRYRTLDEVYLVWGEAQLGRPKKEDKNAVEQAISRLRRKLKELALTISRVTYRIEELKTSS